MTEPTNQPAVECDCPLPEGSAFRCQDIRQQQKAQHPSRCYCQCHTRHQPPAVPLPLCNVHKSLDVRDKLEVEVGNNCVACSLNERAELLKTLAPHVPLTGWKDSVGFLKMKLDRLHKLANPDAVPLDARERAQYVRRTILWDWAGLQRLSIEELGDLIQRIAAALTTTPAATDGTARPLCAVHQSLEDRGQLQVEVGNDCIACSLNERVELRNLITQFASATSQEDAVTVLRRIIERPTTASGSLDAETETGWLLEKIENGAIWYVTVDQLLTWTTDPLKALRLARRADAELLAQIIEDCERIEEHQWG